MSEPKTVAEAMVWEPDYECGHAVWETIVLLRVRIRELEAEVARVHKLPCQKCQTLYDDCQRAEAERDSVIDDIRDTVQAMLANYKSATANNGGIHEIGVLWQAVDEIAARLKEQSDE